MARHKRIANSKIVQVYQSKACNIGATCAALGIDRKTLLNWRHSSPELEQMLAEAEESLIDFSESKLMEQINSGNLTAIIFHLKTKGKKRGYYEHSEIEEHKTTEINLSGLSDDELKQMEQLMRKANTKE